ncbi:hypothetical protein D1007_11516 [Hordeum vulgare]|nr:hypothetical protein D1007_11516 [Hordeum vulgare]
MEHASLSSPGPPVRNTPLPLSLHFAQILPLAPPSSMDGDLMNLGDAATAAPPVAKKKGTRKPRSECTPAEIAKLDGDSAKRRGRRLRVAETKKVAAYVIQAAARLQSHHLADIDEKESVFSKAHTLLMLGLAGLQPTILSVATMARTSTGSSTARPPRYRSTTPKTPGCRPPTHGHGQRGSPPRRSTT